jgi:DNA/RNA-binding domain of Phe-tRNA-synthetase-like protein
MFVVTQAWRETYPGACAGILAVRGAANPPHHPALEEKKRFLEEELRARFAGQDREAVRALPVIQAYEAYYRRFKKTYHVQLQLESIVFKDKPIPRVAALVEAMFMAEIKNLLLTAGHDLGLLELPVTLDVATGNERYTLLRGDEQQLKAGDMFMFDRAGVLTSVLYGLDYRTRLTSATQDALFTVYAPPGIGKETVQNHLLDIQENILVVSPQARIDRLEVFTT